VTWPIVALGDVAEKIDYGLTASADTNIEGPRFLRITDLQDNTVDWNTVPSCKCDKDELEKYALVSGDIVFARTGATTGKSYLINAMPEKAVFASYLIRVRPSELVDSLYLSYFFKSVWYWNQIEAMANGAAQPGVNSTKLKELQIPLPPLEEQKRIAAILDKADAICHKRQQAIDLTDQLLRSAFLELFGDPVTNPKGFETKTIEELVSTEKYSLKRGPFGGALKKEIFVDSGYLVYEQYHALNNDFSYQRYFIDENKFDELKAFEVRAGDIIISCSGVNLGRLAIVPDGSQRGIINQALLKLTLNEDIILNEMFVSIFTHPNFKAGFFGFKRGSGVPNFPPMSTFKEFNFITPPLDLQKEYLKQVAAIKINKQTIEKMMEKSENLFLSLTQQAFRGNLSKQTAAA